MTKKMTFDPKNSSFPGPDRNPILNQIWPNHYHSEPDEDHFVERMAKQLTTGMCIVTSEFPREVRKIENIKRLCLARVVEIKCSAGFLLSLKYNSKILTVE